MVLLTESSESAVASSPVRNAHCDFEGLFYDRARRCLHAHEQRSERRADARHPDKSFRDLDLVFDGERLHEITQVPRCGVWSRRKEAA